MRPWSSASGAKAPKIAQENGVAEAAPLQVGERDAGFY